MSRYEVDKVCRDVVLQDAQRQKFISDPEGFLAAFDLSEDERQAFARQDFATLYGMGAHPFLLFGCLTRTRRGDFREIVKQYCESIQPYGYPDFST